MPAKAYGGAKPKVLNPRFFWVFLFGKTSPGNKCLPPCPSFLVGALLGRVLGSGFGSWVLYFNER